MPDEIAYNECVVHYGKKVYKIYPLILIGIIIILFGWGVISSIGIAVGNIISSIFVVMMDLISPFINILYNIFNFIFALIISGIDVIIPIFMSVPQIVYIGFGIIFGPLLCVMVYCLSRRVSVGYQAFIVTSSLPIGMLLSTFIMLYYNPIIGIVIFGIATFLPLIWADDLDRHNRSRKCVKKD